MIVYCYVLLILYVNGLILSKNPEKFGYRLGDLLTTLPLIGRILGWW